MSSGVGEQAADAPPAGAAASDAPKRCAAVKISPPPSPPPSGVDIDGVPLRDGQKIDLKHLLGHMPDIDDDEDDEPATATGEDGAAASSAARLIETQFQPVDDDDLVFGDDDDDYDDDDDDGGGGWNEAGGDAPSSAEQPAAPVQRKQRRSSLKRCAMHSEHPESPSGDDQTPPTDAAEMQGGGDHSHKAVRFADAVGLGLADVRDLVDTDEPPTIPASALRDLHVRRRKRSKSHLTYSIDFSQPGSDPTFITRVLADKVSASRYLPFLIRRTVKISVHPRIFSGEFSIF